MKVLQVHNKYRYYGGEDVVVNNEFRLLRNNGVIVEQLLFDNSTVSFSNSAYNVSSAYKLKTRIDIFKPDIIHVHNLFYNASPSILYEAKKNKLPVILTLHNYRLICPSALLLRDSKPCTLCVGNIFPYNAVRYSCFQDSTVKSFALSTNLFIHNLFKTWNNKVDKVIVLTPFAKDFFLKSHLKLKQANIIIKPNSTDDIFSEEVLRTSTDYLYVGRLSKEKGVNYIVNAFNKLPNLKLHIIGTGELEDALRGIANSNIVFYGKQEYSFVAKMYNRAKALVFPSICFEGLPNTIIEAFSAGLPVICSNIDNLNQIVTSGYNGLTFNIGNESDLVKTISQFDEMDTETIGLNARKTYQEKYTHELNFQHLSTIYKELIRT